MLEAYWTFFSFSGKWRSSSDPFRSSMAACITLQTADGLAEIMVRSLRQGLRSEKRFANHQEPLPITNHWPCHPAPACSAPALCGSCVRKHEDLRHRCVLEHLLHLPLVLMQLRGCGSWRWPQPPLPHPHWPKQCIISFSVTVAATSSACGGKGSAGASLSVCFRHLRFLNAGCSLQQWASHMLSPKSTLLLHPHGRKCDHSASCCRPHPQFGSTPARPGLLGNVAATWNSDSVWRLPTKGQLSSAASPGTLLAEDPGWMHAVSNELPDDWHPVWTLFEEATKERSYISIYAQNTPLYTARHIYWHYLTFIYHISEPLVFETFRNKT